MSTPLMLLAGRNFGSSVNSILTRGADYAHHITACPHNFKKPNGISELNKNKIGQALSCKQCILDRL